MNQCNIPFMCCFNRTLAESRFSEWDNVDRLTSKSTDWSGSYVKDNFIDETYICMLDEVFPFTGDVLAKCFALLQAVLRNDTQV